MTGVCAIPAMLLVIALQVGFAAGVVAFNGFLFVITGHAILRLTHLAVYSEFTIQSSMQVGAAGGAIMSPALAIFNGIAENCLRIRAPQQGDEDEDGDGDGDGEEALGVCSIAPNMIARNMLSLGMSTALGAAAGGVGSKVLLLHGVSVMDPLHAARAGALGGTVLGPGIVIGGLV